MHCLNTWLRQASSSEQEPGRHAPLLSLPACANLAKWAHSSPLHTCALPEFPNQLADRCGWTAQHERHQSRRACGRDQASSLVQGLNTGCYRLLLQRSEFVGWPVQLHLALCNWSPRHIVSCARRRSPWTAQLTGAATTTGSRCCTRQ